MKHCFRFSCVYLAVMFFWIWSLSFLPVSCQAQEPFADIVAKVKPSVVIVEGFKDTNRVSIGSGFIISGNGDVVTNYHVIDSCFSAKIFLINGKEIEVRGIVAKDEKADLVRLALADIDTTFDSLATFDTLRAGDVILVIGNPLGLWWSVSNGIIMHEARYIRKFDASYLQHNATVYSGSSGSPLFNLRGQAIGVHTLTPTGIENIHYAIPASKIKNLPPGGLVTLPEERATKDTLWAKSPDGHYILGNALFSTGKYAKALPHLKETLNIRKNDAAMHFMIGYCLEQSDSIDQAIEAYNQAVSINRDFFEAWFHLGFLYDTKQRDQEAAQAYEQARRIKPDHKVLLIHLGKLYLSLNKPLKAIEVLRNLIKVSPGGDAECLFHVLLGKAYFMSKRFLDAEKAFKLAIALTTERMRHSCHPKAYSALAELYDTMGRTEEAIIYRERAKEARPTIIPYKEPLQPKILPWVNELALPKASCPDSAEDALINGELLEQQGDYEKALQKYKEATEICSVYVGAYTCLVALYSKLGRYLDATEVLKDALRIKHCFVWAYHRLAIIHSILGLDAESEEFFKKIEYDTQEPCEDLYNVDYLYINEWSPAIPPDTAFKCCALGVVCEIQGDTMEAMERYKQAIQIYPNFVEAHFLLGRAYVSLGNYVEALKELKLLKGLNDFLADKLLKLIYPQ